MLEEDLVHEALHEEQAAAAAGGGRGRALAGVEAWARVLDGHPQLLRGELDVDPHGPARERRRLAAGAAGLVQGGPVGRHLAGQLEGPVDDRVVQRLLDGDLHVEEVAGLDEPELGHAGGEVREDVRDHRRVGREDERARGELEPAQPLVAPGALLAPLEALADDEVELGVAEGLPQVVRGPGPQRVHRHLLAAEARDDHDRQVGVAAAQGPGELDPVHAARHGHVGEDQVHLQPAQGLDRGLARLDRMDLVALAEEPGERVAHRLVVLDE